MNAHFYQMKDIKMLIRTSFVVAKAKAQKQWTVEEVLLWTVELFEDTYPSQMGSSHSSHPMVLNSWVQILLFGLLTL